MRNISEYVVPSTNNVKFLPLHNSILIRFFLLRYCPKNFFFRSKLKSISFGYFSITFFSPSTDCPFYFGRGEGSVVWAKLSDVSRRPVLKKKLLAIKIKREWRKTERKRERNFSFTGFGLSGLLDAITLHDLNGPANNTDSSTYI